MCASFFRLRFSSARFSNFFHLALATEFCIGAAGTNGSLMYVPRPISDPYSKIPNNLKISLFVSYKYISFKLKQGHRFNFLARVRYLRIRVGKGSDMTLFSLTLDIESGSQGTQAKRCCNKSLKPYFLVFTLYISELLQESILEKDESTHENVGNLTLKIPSYNLQNLF